MNQIKLTKIDIDTAWEVPWKCWELMKTNYWLALSTALILLAATLLQSIPLIGVLVSIPLVIALRVGVLFVVKDWEQSEASSFSKLTEKAFDKDLLQPLLPLILIEIALAVISSFFTANDSSLTLVGIVGLPSLVISSFVSLMIPQLVFNKGLTIQEAFHNSLEVIKINIVPFFFMWMFISLLALIATVLLLLPFIFGFLPASICVPYVVYRTFFEGLVLKDATPQEN